MQFLVPTCKHVTPTNRRTLPHRPAPRSRLDDNVSLSLENIEAGHSQLEQTYARAQSNAGLILKLAAVIALFAMFFIIFIA